MSVLIGGFWFIVGFSLVVFAASARIITVSVVLACGRLRLPAKSNSSLQQTMLRMKQDMDW